MLHNPEKTPAEAERVEELVERLRAAGVDLWTDQGQLRYRSRPGAFTEALKEAVRARREELVAFLEAGRVGESGALHRRSDRTRFPLSSMQRRLWLLDAMGGGGAYHVPQGFRIRGPLDLGALENSLTSLAERHEVLRSRLGRGSADGEMLILLPAPVPVTRIDASGWTEAQIQDELRRLAELPFDLERDPLLRAHWLQAGDADGFLLLCLHHWVTDLWSNPVFFRDLAAFYAESTGGAPAELPALPVQYGDYAAWQQEWLDGPGGQQEMAYWRSRLAAPPVVEFPTDHRRPAEFRYRGASATWNIPAEAAGQVTAYLREERMTLFMGMLAAWGVLLHKYTGQEDLLTATPVSNRNDASLEHLIGFFVNTLPLRLRVDPRLSFRDFARETVRACLGDLDHATAPLDSVLDAIKAPRAPDRNPLFQHVLIVNPPAGGGFSLPGLDVASVRIGSSSSKFDLTLTVQPEGADLRLFCEYASDLFDGRTVESLLRRFALLLEKAFARPDTPIGEISLLSPGEEKQLDEWNRTTSDYPRDRSVPEVFSETARRHAGSPAVAFAEGSWTYAELDRAAEAVAAQLRPLQLAPGAPVAVFADRSPWLLAALLGILREGGAYCPVDLRYPAERIALVLERARPAAVLVAPGLEPRVPAGLGPVNILPAGPPPSSGGARLEPRAPVPPETAAYVNFTSGSTGIPKGVLVPHRAILRLVCGTRYARLDQGTRTLHHSSIAFDASTLEIWAPLLHGGTCCLAPDDLPSAAGLRDALRRFRVNTLWLTAGLFNTLIDEDPSVLQGVDQILTGGEALSVPHVRRALAALPETRLINGYGPTENTTFTACYPIPRDLPDEAVSVPIGFPVSNTRCYVVDAGLRRVPPGMPGELLAAGDGLALGYLHDPERTEESFLVQQFAPNLPPERLYRTGDIVRFLEDGSLEFLGRRDGQVKIRGFRVELGDIEAVLRSSPGVASAVVLAVSSPEGSRRLAAYYTCEPGKSASAESLRQQCSACLPDYMVPAAFAALAALPLNASGKVDRAALPPPVFTTGGPAQAQPGRKGGLWEELLRSIWRETLGLEDIGLDDNFFEIGGNSLSAVKVFSRIESLLHRKVPLSALLRAPTIRQLAVDLSGSTASGSGLVVPIQPHGTRPPVFWLHSVGGAGGGGLLGYRDLCLRLGEDQPSFGIEAPDRAFASLAEMAAAYAEAIAAFHPRGPYLIAGFCFGGNLAHAVACELQHRGRPVAGLYLLECSPPRWLRGGPFRYALTPSGLGVLSRRTRFYVRHGTLGSVLRRTLRTRLARVLRRMRLTGTKGAHGGGSGAEGQPRPRLAIRTEDYPEHLRSHVERHMEALILSRMGVFEGDAVLFRVARALSFAGMRPDFGWSDWVRGRLRIERIEGDHHHFLEPPAVERLAERLRSHLEQAAPA